MLLSMIFNQVCYSASLMLTPQGLLRLMSLHLLKHSLFLIILVFIRGNIWKPTSGCIFTFRFKVISSNIPLLLSCATRPHLYAPHHALSMLARTRTAETVTKEFASLSGCCCLSFYWPLRLPEQAHTQNYRLWWIAVCQPFIPVANQLDFAELSIWYRLTR